MLGFSVMGYLYLGIRVLGLGITVGGLIRFAWVRPFGDCPGMADAPWLRAHLRDVDPKQKT